MSLVVNHNLMAANVARNLNAHYANLSNSTQRLSTGLRINSAADDAAGLAIRELQRADIAALQQGARNANDAISLIQVADGALQIIDEKLIRMKELAEQAATGTYDSTQRLMIESEYQAMASEITRIANATDFNGMKLLDGTLSADEHNGSKFDAEGKMKIHFGTGNDSAEDYYYIQIGEATSQAFGLGDGSTWEDAQDRIVRSFQTSLKEQMKAWQESGDYTAEELATLKEASSTWVENFEEQLAKYTKFSNASELETLYDKFKDDDEVAALSDLFEESIENFDSVTYREMNKMQYALGHAAVRKAELFEFENYSPASSVFPIASAAQEAVNTEGTTYETIVFDPSTFTYTTNDSITVTRGTALTYTLVAGDTDLDNLITNMNADLTFGAVYEASASPDGMLVLRNKTAGSAASTATAATYTEVTGGTVVANGTITAGDEGSIQEAYDLAEKAVATATPGPSGAIWDAEEAIDAAVEFTQFLTRIPDAVAGSQATINANLGTAGTTDWDDGNGNYFRLHYNSSGAIDKIDYDNAGTFTAGAFYTVSTNSVLASNFTLGDINTVVLDGASTNVYTIDYTSNVLTAKNNGNTFTLNSDGLIVSVVDTSSNVFDVSSKRDSVGNGLHSYVNKMTSGTATIYLDGSVDVNVAGGTGRSIIDNVASMVMNGGGTYTFNGGDIVSVINGNGSVLTLDRTGGYTVDEITTVTDKNGNVSTVSDGLIEETTFGENSYGVSVDVGTGNYNITDESGNVYTFKPDGTLYKAVSSSGDDITTLTLAADGILSDVFEDTTAEAMSRDYAGFTIATQEDAQKSLAAINDAIVVKDKIRANLGSLQNRLENTISNINIQAENLQAAESRISDVDVSTEMTEFVRQQILTQSAVAMLSQANSLPQMAMQLIGG